MTYDAGYIKHILGGKLILRLIYPVRKKKAHQLTAMMRIKKPQEILLQVRINLSLLEFLHSFSKFCET